MRSTLKMGIATLVLAASLAAAAPAFARGRPDDRAGIRGINGATAPAAVRPDDRAGIRGLFPQTLASAGDHAVPGFDWTAAGTGAGVATAAVVLLILTGALLLRRSQRRGELPA